VPPRTGNWDTPTDSPGMLDESVAECERARELDPFVKANGSVLNSYLYLGHYQKFLESLPVDDSSFILFTVVLENFPKRSSIMLRKILIVRTISTVPCIRE
jgi:hypothetical protein